MKYAFIIAFALSSFAARSQDDYCTHIDRSVDDFTGEVLRLSPFLNQVAFIQTIKGNDTVSLIDLTSYAFSVSVNETGAFILFEDGTKIERANTEVDVDVAKNTYKGDYEYSGIIRLSDSDLLILASKKIKKFRLYIYDTEVSDADAIKYMEYAKCLIN